MAVVRMTLSNAVEEVASLRWISWRSFLGLSSHQGATCRSSVRGCLPPCSAETRRPSASAKNLPMRRMLMNVSFSSRRWTSWGHSWWLLAAHTQKQTHRGFLAGGRTIYRRVEQTRNCGEFSEIFGVDFDGRIFQGSNWCFWAKNLKNISKELSEEYTCQRGAPEGLNRGQAGRPRALGPAGLGHFWPSFTSFFSGGFLVQLFASVQYILHALHRPNPVNHSFFAFDVHLQHYFSTLCHSPCPMLNHSSHGAIFAENHMSFPCMAAPSFELFACGGR